MTTFNNEAEFEHALIEVLKNKGWGDEDVIKYPTEEDLLNNWAEILFANNKDVDRLNDVPLTNTEMQQIIEQILELKTPLKLNGFINGKSVAITRDNPDDTLHFGKEVSLKIYDRQEIAAGQSRYQIVQQPQFKRMSPLLRDRRGDLMLLINGMPVIHIELKRSGVPVSKAYKQIERYVAEGMFTGLFSLVQVFVAMEPNETRYFANQGIDGTFNSDFYFNWADFNNEPINDWKTIASVLLSIPMAHQLIGFYTVADDTDGVLKVMRSYQYYAANAISDKVAKTDWTNTNPNHERLGGYVWHTTGSGKTLTSFKSAQLIAQSKDADKVIFLMDRIELGTQSLLEYRGFAGDSQVVQATENTYMLVTKLKSIDPADTLIVSSIQKMSNIYEESQQNSHDIATINAKRLVFIVDEAHRSTMSAGTEDKDGMLITIKNTFPTALFFGFTGTPILDENQRNRNTTATVFGSELHRYSIADGIRDGNVLGFDPYKVMTFKDKDLRREVALMQAKAATESEALGDDKKKDVYLKFMDKTQVPMAGYKNDKGKHIKGIEDFVPRSQYTSEAHQQTVMEDILDNWLTLSQNNKFHAIFATSSIVEAIEYYRLIKSAKTDLNITALFDPNIDESGDTATVKFKQDGLVEIMTDYNARYQQSFDLASHAKYKKDIAARLAHKKPYLRIHQTPEQQIDLLIVVDQMLTGFDSKWLNTLYIDKVLEYQNIIQAFSRTNRLFGTDKPFGTIRYYRYPHTMERNVNAAIKLYSGNKPIGLFVDRLDSNLEHMNLLFKDIIDVFNNAGIENFVSLPEEVSERAQFAKLFKLFNEHLEAAKIQGFVWGKKPKNSKVELLIDEQTYLILVLRYKELAGEGGGVGPSEPPFDIEGHLTEIDTGIIDAEYINSRFEKYLKILQAEGSNSEQIQQSIDELHKSFASLSKEEQKYANIFLNDVQRGDAKLEEGKTFRDYINDYQTSAKDLQITNIVNVFGLDKEKLTQLMSAGVDSNNINDFGRFDALKATVDKAKAKAYFEEKEGAVFSAFQVNMKIDKLLQEFVENGGIEI